jgi:hypothetical protein
LWEIEAKIERVSKRLAASIKPNPRSSKNPHQSRRDKQIRWFDPKSFVLNPLPVVYLSQRVNSFRRSHRMNLQIEVPSNLELLLRKRAEEEGVPVEAIVLAAVTDKLENTTSFSPDYTADQFSSWLRAWADRFPKLDVLIDDSRESIYEGRGE